MEIRTEGAPLSDTADTQPTEPLKRVRRWHHRGFTGCSTCRRRHVRCDETSPACNNCVRLGRECDGAQGRMTFKVYGLSQTPTDSSPESSRAPKRQKNNSTSSPESSDASVVSPSEEKEDVDTKQTRKAMIAPATLPQPTTKFRFQDPVTTISIAKSIQRAEERYLTYFADQVSTFLIIYNAPHNANPYRTHFPDFARSSPTMVDAMQALGALHLANTSVGSQRNRHLQQAMGKYGVVVKGFRARYSDPSQQLGLTDFATCLLLSLFEVCFPLALRPASHGQSTNIPTDDGFPTPQLGSTSQRSSRNLQPPLLPATRRLGT
jgi:Fungal Zn(2)-Cys(6) binuclear cluster domain.